MFILGIDGGGTHTRLELRDSENRLIRREQLGPFNPASIGEAAFRLRVKEILSLCPKTGSLRCICIGGAGVSGGRMEALLREELQAAGFSGRLLLKGDHEIALAGALPGPGCLLIAGTGSILCGRDAAGNVLRCGGFGHLLDDGGSGYAIGRDALTAAVKVTDGRCPESLLSAEIFSRIGSSGDIVNYVYHSGKGKADIAALSRIVLDCACRDDGVSLAILRRGADALAELVDAMLPRIGLANPPLVLSGGLLSEDNIYSRMVREALNGKVTITEPLHDALWGAAQLAWEAACT